jgi:hypothetical protein
MIDINKITPPTFIIDFKDKDIELNLKNFLKVPNYFY